MKHALSKRNRNIIITVIALLIVGASILDRVFISKKFTTTTNTNNLTTDKYFFHNKSFKVIYVADGDTFDIATEKGKTRIRLLGVDTPETKKPNTPVQHFGPEASAYTKSTLLGKKVIILIDAISPSRDKYGRLLCYIKLENGKLFNEELVINGFAYADPRFEHSHYNQFKLLMKKARKAKVGLWENLEPKDLPEWLF